MISREQLRQFATFESPDETAVSFFFQPRTPQNKAHREEQIVLKDLVRQALDHAEQKSQGRTELKKDLERILSLGESLRNNGTHGKVVFACAAQGIWHELDVPAELPTTELHVNRCFRLKPLTMALNASLRTLIAVVDREHARIYEFSGNEWKQLDEIVNPLPRKTRTDGFAGYNAGHKERHLDNEAMRHFKEVAERLRILFESHAYDALIVAGRDEVVPDFAQYLHTDVHRRMIGQFHADAATSAREQMLDEVHRILDEHAANERQALVREVIGEAQRDGNGAIGVRNVLRAMERGEVQRLLVGRNFTAQASTCKNCGHMDTRVSKACGVCGQDAIEVKEISDAVIRRAILGNVEIVYMFDDDDFDRIGNIGALLRFRADQNTPAKLAG